MLSFEQLEYEAAFKKQDELEDYLESFFEPLNFEQYIISDKANDEERKAIEAMFDDDEALYDRAQNIVSEYPLCLEAFYVCTCLLDETSQNLMFTDAYKLVDCYKELSPYEKDCLLSILRLYVTFLLNISNVTGGIRVMNKVCELEGKYSNDSIIKLSYMYAMIEDAKNFYDLFLKTSFNDVHPYILLLITLLKHEEEEKAREVLSELIDKFKYADYIDHVWDLEEVDNIEANEFKDAMEVCFEDMCAIPNFFSWCKDNKQQVYKS